MRSITRGERKKIHRENRREILSKEHGLKEYSKKKKTINKSSILIFASILLIFLTLGLIASVDTIGRVGYVDVDVALEEGMLFTSPESFLEKYKQTLTNLDGDIVHKKGIIEVVGSGSKEITYVQESTEITNTVVGIYKGRTNQIDRIGVIGIYREENPRFPLGFKENIITAISTVLDTSFNESEEILKNHNIVTDTGGIVLESAIFEYENKEFVFLVEGQNFFFTIEEKKPLVKN